MKIPLRLVYAVAALACLARAAGAQGVPMPVRPPATDTIRADSAARDTARRKPLVQWVQEDSVMKALVARAGYTATRYQGNNVTFNANTRGISIIGNRAGVSRSGTIVVGDTINYNDSTKIIVALGDTVVLRDTTQEDVVSRGRITYNVASQRGSVTNISTSIAQTGEKWFLQGAQASYINDTTKGKQRTFFAKNGIITSCDDSIPDYYFKAEQIKMVSKNMLVARPAILYISDVPVMYLPFMFQDMRSGRRSGVLTPRFGVSELFRNSPTYRRHAENLGYYFAINDYMDAAMWLDWRSGSRPSQGDPGWVKLNGEWQYRWLDRFINGRFAAFQFSQRDGSKNTALSWSHTQQFGAVTSFNAQMNYMTNTVVQHQTTFDPTLVNGTIGSSFALQTKIFGLSPSFGGTRTQFTGRKDVEQTFPQFSIPAVTFAPTSWLSWSPGLQVTNVEHLNVDQSGQLGFQFITRSNGTLDSVRVKQNVRNTDWTIASPIKIAGFLLTNNFAVHDQDFRAPASIPIVDPLDSTRQTTRFFARTFSTEVNWTTGFSLPTLLQGTLNLSPHASFDNVSPHAFWARTYLSGGQFVHQKKRMSGGIGMTPTLFAIFPGIGGISKFRHSITPSISWDYAPASTVPTAFLAAFNERSQGYLGNLARNQLTFQLSQVFEAKMRKTDSTGAVGSTNVKLLSLNFTPLSYDFERARVTHRSGFSTGTFGYSIASDLAPGFSTNVQYSLYNGDVLSDSARFKPFRTDISTSFTLNGQSGLIGALSRVFGYAVPPSTTQADKLGQSSNDALTNQIASTPAAGSVVRNRQVSLPPTQGWQAQFTFTSDRQRPPTGNGVIIDQDPTAVCATYIANALNYQNCLTQVGVLGLGATPLQRATAGSPFIRTPPRESLQSQMSFHVTPKWQAQWGTIYDFHAREFASQQVTLQRELHDWRAIFAFTQASNGNFAFNFSVSLNAEPDLRFPYDKQTYRNSNR